MVVKAFGGSMEMSRGKLTEDERKEAQRRGMTESYPLVPPRVMDSANRIMNMIGMPGFFGEEDFTKGVQYAGGGPTPYRPNEGPAIAQDARKPQYNFPESELTTRNPIVQAYINEALGTALEAMPEGFSPFQAARTEELPFPQSDEDYNRLREGEQYRDDRGNIYTKPFSPAQTQPSSLFPEDLANRDDFSFFA